MNVLGNAHISMLIGYFATTCSILKDENSSLLISNLLIP